MQNFMSQLDFLFAQLGANLPLVLTAIGALWAVQCLNVLLKYRLNYLGILPRSSFGSVGILFSPFLHGSFEHLFFNSIPLFILMSLVLVSGEALFIKVTLFIVLVSGILVWLFGRRALHIGASGVIMGYWSYVLINAYHQGTILAVLIALLCLYYLAGMFFNLFPTDRRTSWEGHLFGFIAGILASYCLT